MMDINATIIIQAIHFSFAYLILKKLFFVPAVRIVLRERAAEKKIHDHMHESRMQVQQAEARVAALWRSSQQELAHLVPPVDREDLFVFKRIKPVLAAPVLDAEREQALVDAVTHSLVTAVNHVR